MPVVAGLVHRQEKGLSRLLLEKLLVLHLQARHLPKLQGHKLQARHLQGPKLQGPKLQGQHLDHLDSPPQLVQVRACPQPLLGRVQRHPWGLLLLQYPQGLPHQFRQVPSLSAALSEPLLCEHRRLFVLHVLGAHSRGSIPKSTRCPTPS